MSMESVTSTRSTYIRNQSLYLYFPSPPIRLDTVDLPLASHSHFPATFPPTQSDNVHIPLMSRSPETHSSSKRQLMVRTKQGRYRVSDVDDSDSDIDPRSAANTGSLTDTTPSNLAAGITYDSIDNAPSLLAAATPAASYAVTSAVPVAVTADASPASSVPAPIHDNLSTYDSPVPVAQATNEKTVKTVGDTELRVHHRHVRS